MKNILAIILMIYLFQNNVFAEEKVNNKIIFNGDNSIIYVDNTDWLLYKIDIDWKNKKLLETNIDWYNKNKNDDLSNSFNESIEKSRENAKLYYEVLNKQMDVILQEFNENERKKEDEKMKNKIKKFFKNIWDKLLDLTSKSVNIKRNT